MEPKSSLWSLFYTRVIRQTLCPLLLMVVTPNCAVVLPYIIFVHHGSFHSALKDESSVLSLLTTVWSKIDFLDRECWTIVLVSLVLAWASVRFLPGRRYQGPPTMDNFRPTYYDNAVLFYIIYVTSVIAVLCNVSVLHLYTKMPSLFAVLTVFGFAFCLVLYLKGIFHRSAGEHGFTGNPLFDYYWGVELYPVIGQGKGEVSLKQLINCRFGLALWQAAVLVACKIHYEMNASEYTRIGPCAWLNAVVVSAILQTVFLAKFYWWEDGYMQTIDIAVDRFGYYVGWGCIAFVPSFYPLHSYYFIEHSPLSSTPSPWLLFVLMLGLSSIVVQYIIDSERKRVRDTDGESTLFGKKPRIIRANYQDEKGETHSSILLVSGCWSLSRHLNYLFEMIIILSFGLSAGFTSILPYLYFLFIVPLLIHRERRDHDKCSLKYGTYWEEYCKQVPYRIVPFVY